MFVSHGDGLCSTLPPCGPHYTVVHCPENLWRNDISLWTSCSNERKENVSSSSIRGNIALRRISRPHGGQANGMLIHLACCQDIPIASYFRIGNLFTTPRYVSSRLPTWLFSRPLLRGSQYRYQIP